jgi:hypothetical protein
MNAAVTELLQRCRVAGLSLLAEGDALCVDYESEPPPDLIEELKRHKAEVIAALAPSVAGVIAPPRWAERTAGAGEIPFEQPCAERRGLVERRGGALVHFCIKCGRWGAYGYGATGDHPGRWYCREHRPADDAFARFPRWVGDR